MSMSVQNNRTLSSLHYMAGSHYFDLKKIESAHSSFQKSYDYLKLAILDQLSKANRSIPLEEAT